MNELKIKSGTKKEILEYIKNKTEGRVLSNISNADPEILYTEKMFEWVHNLAEIQIDNYIANGSPLVSICLATGNLKNIKDQFLVTDYADIKLQMEIEKIDDIEGRNKYIDAIKTVINMELTASELFARLRKIAEEYKGVSIKMDPINKDDFVMKS